MQTGRTIKIDFFRGLALITIFIEHVYFNRLGGYTLRSYGIADAGEVFFFLSGFVAAMANDDFLAKHGYVQGQGKALVRCGRIYRAHVAAFLVVVAITLVFSRREGFEVVFAVYGLRDIASGDYSTLAYSLLMLHQPYLFGILPVFVILSVLTPSMLHGLHYSPRLLLLVSAAVYLAVQLFGINLPTYPSGSPWDFNPLAYQFIFLLGMLLGWGHLHGRLRLTHSRHAMIIAFVVLVLVFLIHNFIPFLHRHFLPDPSWYVGGIPLSGKQNIEPMRIIHFLVLAYFVTGVVRQLEYLSPSTRGAVVALAGPVARCGRHSLTVFACSIVLSYLGSFVIAALGDQAAVWVPLNIVGITMLLMVAAWADGRRPRMVAG